MSHAFYIFIIALTVRILNLCFHNLDESFYIVEDQFLYWDWSLKKAFTSNSELNSNVLLERMPGAFLFFQLAIWLAGENLFKVLLVQIFIDSINCVLIAAIAKTLNKNLFFLAGLISSFSPTLVIISSQILSDTIFLLFFTCYIFFLLNFIINRKESYIYLGAFFLGLALFTRTVALPLIFFTLLIVIYIYFKNKYKFFNILKVTSIFLIVSFSFVIPRITNNYNNFNTFSLTSQAGSHFSVWVVPGVLDFESAEKKSIYKKKIEEINVMEENPSDPFEKSSLLKKEAFSTLFSLDKKSVILAWTKGAVLNTISPSLMLDKRIREIEHPSFYESNRNVKKWLTRIFYEDKFNKYKIIILLATFSSLIFTALVTIGVFIGFKDNASISMVLIIILFYFLLVTGPVFSPKYIHPIFPALVVWEAFAVARAFQFFIKYFIKEKSN